MSHIANWIRYLFHAIVVGLALAFLVVYLFPAAAGRLTPPEAPAPSPVPPDSYADAVNRTAPAVVSIYTRTLSSQSVPPAVQRLLGRRHVYLMRSDMGSGVLVSEDGYILTNHHVISGVTKVRVALWDGRIAFADLVGSDPQSDLAVLKIDFTGLPAAPIAESPNYRVGDVVLAIGNALGLSHTVTMGIISATGRNDPGSLVFEDFIQTDAAINAGNSGGALINTRGELIGINTRNLSGIPGAENIGFAIPVTIARSVMQDIIEYGSVQRGWLGIDAVDMPLAIQSDGTVARRGVEIRGVTRDGPAWNAGIRQGDVILTLNGQETNDASAFLLAISQLAPGDEVELDVQRMQSVFQTHATLIQQPPIE